MVSTIEDPSDALRQGIRACRQDRWREGYQILSELGRAFEGRSQLPALFYGYLGQAIARCEGRKRVGVDLCRHAVESEPFRPENYLNLASVYLIAGNRRRAIRALQDGLALDNTHPGLVDFQKKLGVRRKPVIPFLPRGNVLNYLLGRLTFWVTESRAERRRRLEEERELEIRLRRG